MTVTKPRAIACCIIAHAVFAYLGAEWIDIYILVLLAAICALPFWWAAIGFRGLRTRAVWWSLAVGSVIYLPSVRVILLMLSSARGGPR